MTRLSPLAPLLASTLLFGCGAESSNWSPPTTGNNDPGSPQNQDGGGGGGGGGGGADGGGPMHGSPDMAMHVMENPGAVGPHGGTVDLLHFGLSGDTRPPACEATAQYPTMIIDAIADQFKARSAQFVFDLGDHMYVCNNDLNVATTQMGLFVQATQRYGGTWFMTMGNHECWKGPCLAGSQQANYVAFMKALAPISNLPYYTFSVQTSLGLATFVVVADNAWDNTQSAWLQQTLTTADKSAAYTIVLRHHPEGDTSVATNPESVAIIRAHKFSLFLTGHEHRYQHQTVDQGRDVIIGNGGAPLIASGTFYGYAMVDQQRSGKLQVTVFDVNGNTLQDSFSVGPNQ